jgi:hypothetical protein
MKRWVRLLFLAAAMVLPAAGAEAGPNPSGIDYGAVFKAAMAATPVPPEWDGVWSVEDSVYDCTTGDLIAFVPGTDTICGGKDYGGMPPGSGISFSCTGTADGSSVHVTCSGSIEILPDCQFNMVTTTDGTISVDSYHLVIVSNTTYTGDGTGCDFFPDRCTRTVSDGTRIGPSPTDWCATPTRAGTWGEVKARYR